MLNLKQTLCYNPNIAWRAIDEEVIVIPLESIHEQETPRVKLFNITGSRIWELINEACSIENIIKVLYEEFDINYDELVSDTIEFLSLLVELKLLLIKDAPNKGL